MTKLLTTAAILAAFVIPAVADPASTGNEWVNRCNSKNDALQVACIAYARGVADGLALWQIVAPDSAKACIAPEIEAGQLVDVAKAYIKANPKTRADFAGSLLALSFVAAWPCASAEASN